MTDYEILPCPHCNGEGRLGTFDNPMKGTSTWHVRCAEDYDHVGPDGHTANAAVKAWNLESLKAHFPRNA